MAVDCEDCEMAFRLRPKRMVLMVLYSVLELAIGIEATGVVFPAVKRDVDDSMMRRQSDNWASHPISYIKL